MKKTTNIVALLLSGCLILSGCGMSNTAKGGLIGGGGGAALGALVGGLAGKGKVLPSVQLSEQPLVRVPVY